MSIDISPMLSDMYKIPAMLLILHWIKLVLSFPVTIYNAAIFKNDTQSNRVFDTSTVNKDAHMTIKEINSFLQHWKFVFIATNAGY